MENGQLNVLLNCPTTLNSALASIDIIKSGFSDLPDIIAEKTDDFTNTLSQGLISYQYFPILIIALLIIWILVLVGSLAWQYALILSIIFIIILYSFYVAYQAEVKFLVQNNSQQTINEIIQIINARWAKIRPDIESAYINANRLATIRCPPNVCTN